jgi:hypothetical protein
MTSQTINATTNTNTIRIRRFKSGHYITLRKPNAAVHCSGVFLKVMTWIRRQERRSFGGTYGRYSPVRPVGDLPAIA